MHLVVVAKVGWGYMAKNKDVGAWYSGRKDPHTGHYYIRAEHPNATAICMQRN